MLRRLKKPGLRVALVITFSLALVVLLGVLHLFISQLVSSFLETRLLEHGHAKTRELATILTGPDAEKQAMGAIAMLPHTDKDFTYAAVVSGSGEFILEGGERPEKLETLLPLLSQPGGPTSFLLPNGDRLMVEAVAPPRGEAVSQRVMVVVDFSPLRNILSKLTLLLVAAFMIGLVILVGVIYIVTYKLILRPLDQMMVAARKMAEGDLTGRVTMEASGELGQLAVALDGIGQSLRKTLGQVRGVS
ncbi:MAG TPA: methyl-accepting chemotaxis protein, partial [Archangium sp.]